MDSKAEKEFNCEKICEVLVTEVTCQAAELVRERERVSCDACIYIDTVPQSGDGWVLPGSKGVRCPVTPGHGSGIGYSRRRPPGATRSWAECHLKQLLTSPAVSDSCTARTSTIDMSNASNSTTCFCFSVMRKILLTMDDDDNGNEGKVWTGLRWWPENFTDEQMDAENCTALHPLTYHYIAYCLFCKIRITL